MSDEAALAAAPGLAGPGSSGGGGCGDSDSADGGRTTSATSSDVELPPTLRSVLSEESEEGLPAAVALAATLRGEEDTPDANTNTVVQSGGGDIVSDDGGRTASAASSEGEALLASALDSGGVGALL